MRKLILTILVLCFVATLQAEHRRPLVYVIPAETGQVVSLSNISGLDNHLVLQFKEHTGETNCSELISMTPWKRMDFDPTHWCWIPEPIYGTFYVFSVWPVMVNGVSEPVRLPRHGIDERVEELWREIVASREERRKR